MFYQCGLILEGSPPFDLTAQDSHQPISKEGEIYKFVQTNEMQHCSRYSQPAGLFIVVSAQSSIST